MKRLRRALLAPVSLLALGLGLTLGARPTAATAAPQTIEFSGYEWEVRQAGKGGPGPNLWAPANVRVDQDGALHLKISHDAAGWHCAELQTVKKLGFGRYQFQLVGRIDQLDQNVVFGLFDYPTPQVGPDGTNEIDIEFSHWGKLTAPIGNYTIFPVKAGLRQATHAFPITLNGDYTTHRFIRNEKRITFQSLHGHQNGAENEFQKWEYAPDDFEHRVPQAPLPVHLNLWLFKGMPPADGKEVELVVRSFKFTPN